MPFTPRPECARKEDMAKLATMLGGEWEYQPEKGYYFCYFSPAARDLMGARLGQNGIGHSIDAPNSGDNLALCLTPHQADAVHIQLVGTGSLLSRLETWQSTDRASHGR